MTCLDFVWRDMFQYPAKQPLVSFSFRDSIILIWHSVIKLWSHRAMESMFYQLQIP